MARRRSPAQGQRTQSRWRRVDWYACPRADLLSRPGRETPGGRWPSSPPAARQHRGRRRRRFQAPALQLQHRPRPGCRRRWWHAPAPGERGNQRHPRRGARSRASMPARAEVEGHRREEDQEREHQPEVERPGQRQGRSTTTAPASPPGHAPGEGVVGCRVHQRRGRAGGSYEHQQRCQRGGEPGDQQRRCPHVGHSTPRVSSGVGEGRPQRAAHVGKGPGAAGWRSSERCARNRPCAVAGTSGEVDRGFWPGPPPHRHPCLWRAGALLGVSHAHRHSEVERGWRACPAARAAGAPGVERGLPSWVRSAFVPGVRMRPDLGIPRRWQGEWRGRAPVTRRSSRGAGGAAGSRWERCDGTASEAARRGTGWRLALLVGGVHRGPAGWRAARRLPPRCVGESSPRSAASLELRHRPGEEQQAR